MKPNFLFIGADKSGSTWIHSVLHQHPECYTPKIKEIFFFDRFYERGIKWYLSFFKDAPKNVTAIGEICHDYLFSKVAAQRIYNDFPKIKLISCLRNPVDRSFSNYLFLIRSGITRLTFEEALNSFPELIDNGLYYKHISEYFNRFDARQIKVMFFGHLKRNPVSFAKEIFDFLGLSFVNNINYYGKVIPASKPRSFILSSIAKRGANIARQYRMESLVGKIKSSQLSKLLYIPYTHEDKPTMPADMRRRLTSIFREDIRKLQNLLEIDLSHWLDYENP